MATLLLRLSGPMQSWGTGSRFDLRETNKEPSKSGVIGLLAAARGIDRGDWEGLRPMVDVRMGVRHDRRGVLRYDYQTAKDIIAADSSKVHETAISRRFYLADALFLVGLESENESLLKEMSAALRCPTWPLSLGRKSYVPSEPVALDNDIADEPLLDSLVQYNWLSDRVDEPDWCQISLESEDESGVMYFDQPIGPFSERRFGARFVTTKRIRKEGKDVS